MTGKKVLMGAALMLALATQAQAVEKTAIDKRLNTPMDVDVQALQTFIGSLTTRIEHDLGIQITRLTHQVEVVNNLIPRIDERIRAIVPNWDACPHSLVDVPNVSTYDPTQKRMTWQPASNAWVAQPLQSWEHN